MRETARLIGVLTAICAVAGLLLAWVNDRTRDRIAAALQQERMDAFRDVLPDPGAPDTGDGATGDGRWWGSPRPSGHGRDVLPGGAALDTNDVCRVEADGRAWTFQRARDEGRTVGVAFETQSSKGYGGKISLMVGLDTRGAVNAIQILQHMETPGLGAKIDGATFKGQFRGRSIRNTRWAVRKDRGDIDEITAATISSRAVVGAIKQGLDVYLANEERILETAGRTAEAGLKH